MCRTYIKHREHNGVARREIKIARIEKQACAQKSTRGRRNGGINLASAAGKYQLNNEDGMIKRRYQYHDENGKRRRNGENKQQASKKRAAAAAAAMRQCRNEGETGGRRKAAWKAARAAAHQQKCTARRRSCYRQQKRDKQSSGDNGGGGVIEAKGKVTAASGINISMENIRGIKRRHIKRSGSIALARKAERQHQAGGENGAV